MKAHLLRKASIWAGVAFVCTAPLSAVGQPFGPGPGSWGDETQAPRRPWMRRGPAGQHLDDFADKQGLEQDQLDGPRGTPHDRRQTGPWGGRGRAMGRRGFSGPQGPRGGRAQEFGGRGPQAPWMEQGPGRAMGRRGFSGPQGQRYGLGRGPGRGSGSPEGQAPWMGQGRGPLGRRGRHQGREFRGPRPDGVDGHRREEAREKIRDRALTRLKDRLDISTDKWEKVESALAKVMEARGAERTGAIGRTAHRRAGIPGGSPPMPEAEALKALLQDDDAEEAQFEEKVEAYRAAKEKKQKELDEARKELAALLTKRQIAQLLMLGILD